MQTQIVSKLLSQDFFIVQIILQMSIIYTN